MLPIGKDPGDSIGRLIRARFGDEVHERLVDALVGSIYATDTDRFSLAMVPQLGVLADGRRSLLLAARRARRDAERQRAVVPGASTRHGDPRIGGRRGGRRGAVIPRLAAVASVGREGAAWRVDDERADAVVLATPADATARLVAPMQPTS